MRENFALNLFHQGTNYQSYKYFGSELTKVGGESGAIFRVWAPHALNVCVVGDFNDWDKSKGRMEEIDEGVYELFISGVKEYESYKYCIQTAAGEIYKSDPYAYHTETPPYTNSKVYDLDGYEWEDDKYFENLKKKSVYDMPINIYECQLMSWKRDKDGRYLTYRQAADELVKYVFDMGYTHIEFLPLAEFPYDGSWGYQVTGYFAASSRFGTPKDLMYLIDCFHKKGIGVILDWVPAHFPKDAHGLYEFDGEALYESGEWHRKEHKTWGTRRFDYGKAEVQSFLISNAEFWFDYFHIDGMRVDAVASMLYLDYDKKEGEWVPNKFGDNKNLEAVEFIKKLNEEIFTKYPYAMMIAEESTAWPMVSRPTYAGGLGFNFKWNMGWMNDMLTYMSTDPLFRKGVHSKLNFGMFYAFSENFVLPISHDEVVHGKKSLLDKMPGEYLDKFASLRLFYAFMFAHPGKKLMFMGNEFGQFREWDYASGLEFMLLKYPMHKKLKQMVKEINHFYMNTPALYEIDYSWQGFKWLSVDDADRNVVAFKRMDTEGNEIIAAFNFSGTNLEKYPLEASKGDYEVVFCTDIIRYGGKSTYKKKFYRAKRNRKWENPNYNLEINLAKLSAVYLVRKNTGEVKNI